MRPQNPRPQSPAGKLTAGSASGAPTTPADTVPAIPIAKPSAVNPSDPYHWLRYREDPAVIAYLNAENDYTAAIMKPLEPLQETIYQEIRGRIKETDVSVPERRGDYFYYTRTEAGKQYSIYCRKHGTLTATEEILLDANQLAEGQKYFRLGAFEPSPDHSLLAYSTDIEGDEVYTIRVKDLASGRLLTDSIPGASVSLAWANDNRTFLYTIVDEAKRPYQIFRYSLGGDAPGALVFHETDERFNVDLFRAKSGAYILADINSHTTSETRYLPADDPSAAWRILLPRRQDVEYQAVHHTGHFYVRINDAGRNFRLIRVPLDRPAEAEELRAHSASVTLEYLDAFRGHLVLVERENALRHISIENLSTGNRHRVSFEEPAYTVSVLGNLEFGSESLRFSYSSLVTPNSVFDYDMNSRVRTLAKQTEVMGYDPLLYTSERIFATAPDGERVPISLVYRKGLVRDGRAPALLYGYGAYGSNTEPSFSSELLSLLNRGFVYAIAHIRGGAEMGRRWYDDGKMFHKKNTFTDFIACGQHLVAERYTSPSRLAIFGGSAGGLLIGAVVNLCPDLFRAAIAKVPFVDVVNTMLDASLPLTVTEYEEWGNPNEPAAREYIQTYAPYENVRAQEYPDLLITAGLNDPRVSYWEPAKWAARLRATKTGESLLLLKTNMGAGHFGASGRYERFRETAFEYAFLLRSLS